MVRAGRAAVIPLEDAGLTTMREAKDLAAMPKQERKPWK
jgi:hypothetical protein